MYRRSRSHEVMRWIFLAFLILWVFTVIGLATFVFYSTKSVFSLALLGGLAPPVYLSVHIVKYLYRDEDYLILKILQTLHASEKQDDKKAIPEQKSNLTQNFASILDIVDQKRNKLL